MTVPVPSSLICPECGDGDTMHTADGGALCFACRHEWNPAEVVAIPLDRLGVTAVLTVADVLGPPAGIDDLIIDTPTVDDAHVWGTDDEADDDTAQARMDALVGGTATLEGGQYARVIAFPDADHVIVELAGGEQVTVNFADVDRIMPPTPARQLDVDPEDVAVAQAVADGVTNIAGLLIKAAVASIVGEGDTAQIVNGPEGFLPAEPEMFPIVEQAAVHACATLIVMSGLDPAALVAAVDRWSAASQGDQTTEETTNDANQS